MKKLLIAMLLGVSIITVGCGKKDQVNENKNPVEFNKIESSIEEEITDDFEENGNAKPYGYYQDGETEVMVTEENVKFLEDQINELLKENSDLAIELSNKIQECDTMKAENEDLKKQVSNLESEVRSLGGKSSSRAKMLAVARAKIARYESNEYTSGNYYELNYDILTSEEKSKYLEQD